MWAGARLASRLCMPPAGGWALRVVPLVAAALRVRCACGSHATRSAGGDVVDGGQAGSW